MKTILVTGGAGFIGSNYVLCMLAKYQDLTIVNLDKLTYAGNLANLRSVENDDSHIFVKGDIGEAALVNSLMTKHDISALVNFAAESHVDSSTENPGIAAETKGMGTNNRLSTAREASETS